MSNLKVGRWAKVVADEAKHGVPIGTIVLLEAKSKPTEATGSPHVLYKIQNKNGFSRIAIESDLKYYRKRNKKKVK